MNRLPAVGMSFDDWFSLNDADLVDEFRSINPDVGVALPGIHERTEFHEFCEARFYRERALEAA